MDELALLEAARAAGLTVRAEGERLVVRGPRSAEELARALLARKLEVLALLAVGDPAVVWRVEAMRAQLPAAGPLPFLVARSAPHCRGVCLSCGETLAQGADHGTFRCVPCVRAAWLVVAAPARRGDPAQEQHREHEKERAA